MFPSKDINRLEIFARRHRKGWLCLGNQVNGNQIIGEDIRVSLNKLIDQKTSMTIIV
jgi:N6-adenosine-specific RNA methylase IME4